MAVLLQAPYNQFLDDDGNPLTGGFVYTYEAGTDTPKATYTDYTGGTPADNPIELDAAGRADIWIEGDYKITVKDSSLVTIRTVDHIEAVDQGGDMTKAVYDPANIIQQVVGLTAVQTLTNKTLTTPTLTLKQSTGPTPTAEGDIQWDTDDDAIVVGDGSGQKTFRAVTQTTFTPTVRGSGTAGTWNYTTQTGFYQRIGNRVYFDLYVLISSYSGSPTGRLQIQGLPFAVGNTTVNFIGGGSMATPGAGNMLSIEGASGSTTLNVYGRSQTTGAAADSTIAASGSIGFWCSGTYYTAA